MELKSTIIGNVAEQTFRIAHLSDTHISPEYSRQNIVKLKNLLAQTVDEGYDHIVITGDIAGHGEERDFRSVRRLLKYFGLLDYEKLSVTIGNHDIFGGVHRAEDLLSFGRHCRSTIYSEKLQLFERAFRETFPKKAYDGQKLFPFVKIVGPAALIGMNSIAEFHTFLNPFGSNGYVSDEQLESVERILDHPSIGDMKKIVLIHHHFSRYDPYAESLANKLYYRFEARTLKLHNRKKVEETFKKYGVDAVLHGHTHVEEIYSKSKVLFSSTALNSIRAKSDAEKERHDNQLRFNEVVITDNGRVEMKKRRTYTLSTGSSSRALDKKIYE